MLSIDVAPGMPATTHRPVARSARAIVLLYVVVSLLWIALSDRVVGLLVADPELRTLIETLKGWGFVAVTGTVLALLLRRYDAFRAHQAAELERLNRVQRTLSAANEALLRAEGEPALLAEICRAAVDEGGFRFAWVGYREDDEAGTIRPIAHAGYEAGYLAGSTVSWHDNAWGRGPVGVAVREGHPAIARGIADPSVAPWVEAARARGYASAAALPLRQGADVFGVLAIYAGEPDAFGPDEVALLDQLTADLSYGVEALRTRAARAAADTELRRLAAAVEQTADTVVISDLDGRVVYVNPAFERMLGYTSAELVGQPPEVTETIFGASPLEGALWENLRAGRSWSATLPNRRKDGSIVECDVVVALVADEQGRPIGSVGVGRDRSRERALEAQLRQAEKMEAVGQLAGGVAHDFNNLLTAIKGFAELIAGAGDADDQRTADARQIGRAADQGAQLTHQLLAFSRRHPVQPDELDLGEVVGHAAPMLRQLVGEGIELAVRATPNLPHVLADRGQLEQVLLNLAANARDAMPDGGSLKVTVNAVVLDPAFVQAHPGARRGAHVLLAVSDTGTGMDQATQSHLFEPFFTTKHPGEGTGLGLAGAYGIVKQAGGYIGVESELGRGSTIRIYLPAVRPGGVASTPATPPLLDSRRGTETILLVEDEPSVRVFSKRALEERGYRVLAFGDPRLAFEAAAADPAAFDALVTDVVMPGLSGPTLAERVRGLVPGVPVLFISGYAAGRLADRSAARLSKPFSGTELAGAVGTLFGRDE